MQNLLNLLHQHILKINSIEKDYYDYYLSIFSYLMIFYMLAPLFLLFLR